MTQQEFKATAKDWLNHKIILSQKSDWYKKEITRRHAIHFIRDKFSSFLSFPDSYPAAQLALFLKRHEEVLMAVLPVPNNPSYEAAFNSLTALLKEAAKIIDENGLRSIL